MFRKLPTEMIVLIMCHTTRTDLANLVQTDKFMNEIFKNHKACIFRRMQVYQFPEFSGWFGDLPGFDGPIPGGNQTSEQIQCLKDVVLSLNWRGAVPASRGDEAGWVFLQLLEQYGGWRYLYFLNTLKHHLEKEAQNLYIMFHEKIPVMNGKLAMSMVLCLSRMSWDATTIQGVEEEEELAVMPARVENRLQLFRKEPQTLRELIIRTLWYLIFRIVKQAQLLNIVTSYRQRYPPGGIGSSTMVQTEEDFVNLSSEILAKTLLKSFFYFGVTIALQLCEEPVDQVVKIAQSVILWEFEANLRDQLDATVSYIDPSIQEGSLWAAGIGFPTKGWIRKDKA